MAIKGHDEFKIEVGKFGGRGEKKVSYWLVFLSWKREESVESELKGWFLWVKKKGKKEGVSGSHLENKKRKKRKERGSTKSEQRR